MIITRQERQYTESTFSRIGIELIINTVNSYKQVKKKLKTNLRRHLLRIQESRGCAYKLRRVNMDDKLHTNYFTFLPSFSKGTHAEQTPYFWCTYRCFSLIIWLKLSYFSLYFNKKKRANVAALFVIRAICFQEMIKNAWL